MTTTTRQGSGHTNSTEHTKHFYFVHEIQNKSHFHPEFSIGHTAKPDVAVATGITSREEADKIANSLNSHEALVASLTEYKAAIASGQEITLGMAMRASEALRLATQPA